MSRGRRRALRTTKEYRAERTRKAVGYLVLAGDVPAARKLARAEGHNWNTSVWLTALGRILAGETGA